jgi:hypothetical protein
VESLKEYVAGLQKNSPATGTLNPPRRRIA